MLIGNKLEKIRKKEGLSRAAFSELTGIPTPSLINYETKDRDPSFSVVKNLTSIPQLKKYSQWLMLSDDNDLTIDLMIVTNPDDDHISVPISELFSSDVSSLVEKEELCNVISFKEEWLTQDLGVNPKDIFIMLTKGDNMEPTIKEASLIMVDKKVQKKTNGVYVLRFKGELSVKRLQFTMLNTIKVLSDNKTYDTEEINSEQISSTDFKIIGRVVWSGQKL